MKTLKSELLKQPALWMVGVILSLEHLLTVFFWLTERPLLLILSPSTPSVCWPLFSQCETFKPSPEILQILLATYAVLALASAALWGLKKKSQGAITLLWVLLFIKSAFILQDYRLTGNYHYIPTLLTLAFLLIPDRARSLPMTFFVLYFTAGLLKLNPQWLGGSSINERLFPSVFTDLGVWYVLVLELGLIFLLFAKKDRWFYFVFAQLVLFHLYSWHLTRFFYPSVMLLLLGIPLVTRPLVSEWTISDTFKKVFATRSAAVLTVIFLSLQLPQYYLPGDAALTGEGRMYALIMYDGRVQCEPHVTLWKKDQSKETVPLTPPWLMTRTACDPLVYMRLSEHICQWVTKDPAVLQADLTVPVRYQGETQWQPLVSATDICKKPLTYSSFFPNSWIAKFQKDFQINGSK
ncbi:hypothetical protein [Bdellovibrio bacteriovorus]|uniref:HTTM domain-containing protein n=1 Tax=Bdellovibrio bacteriovorus str. Tiberius TaxID=1069642 RepID=K7Z0G1_BDEBC|nr:hypothetical protein [Bdellovibrio bacteriovorus]AFY02495.1 hypothetical protein Bdt_2814 [Bdellovibrio bacteriovorus str. Tiberius]